LRYMSDNFYILNFAGLPPHLADPERSKVKIIPVPYEATVTYRKGTKEAPLAIIQASQNLELWDEELSVQPCEVGISTFPPLMCSSSSPGESCKKIYRYVKEIINPGEFYIFIGGEHTITSGIVKAFSENYSSLSVLQLDAHADLRNTYEGSFYNHACVMRRVQEYVSCFVQLGIRSLSREEARYIEKSAIPYQSAIEVLKYDRWKELIRERLSDTVYLTIDVDVMDPSIVPSVGCPEPGGLDWYKILEIVRYVAGCKRIVGVDIVELSPLPGIVAPDFLVARLIYKIIGYNFFLK